MTAEELNALALRLGLTTKQRRFCEVLASDPERHATRARQAAGYSGTERVLRVGASKELAKPAVKEYMAALEQAPAKGPMVAAIEATRAAIADRAEVLEAITADMRADIADVVRIDKDGNWDLDLPRAIATGKSKFIKEIGYDAQGRVKVKLIDTQKAKDQMARAHKIYEEPATPQKQGNTINILAVLGDLSGADKLEALRQLRERLLNG